MNRSTAKKTASALLRLNEAVQQAQRLAEQLAAPGDAYFGGSPGLVREAREAAGQALDGMLGNINQLHEAVQSIEW